MSLARLENRTITDLVQRLPDAASAANPVDVLGDARANRYRFAMETVIADPNVDGLVILLTPQAMTEIEATAEAVGLLAKETEKPVLACFMGEARVAAGVGVLQAHGVPNYPFPERAALAFKAMAEYRQNHNRPEPKYVSFDNVDRAAVQKLFDSVRAQERVAIADFEARLVMTAYGLPVPRSELAETPEQALEIARQIGYPVVLKIASPDILHKTDIGGVKVGLRGPEEVRDAFELIVYRAQRYVPDAHILGCLVQEMVPAGGTEVLVGMSRDPQFGPLVTFGLGGIYVETLKDVTFRVAPFSIQEAQAMLTEIRAHALLEGVRGQPPADKEAIVDTLLRVGQLVQDFPEIAELDINPLVVYPEQQGAIAIDMRLVLSR
jgi:acetyltransferase